MPEQKYKRRVSCAQILSQDLLNALTTALRKPEPQPSSQTTISAANTPVGSCGKAPNPIAPKPANRMTATSASVISSSRPRANSTSKVPTGGSCNSDPLLVIA